MKGLEFIFLILGVLLIAFMLEGDPDLFDILVVKLQQAATNWNP
jgi:hypothetical protein